MNRPRRNIVAPQRLINEVSAQPRTTTRKTKSGTKTTLNLDLSDVPPSDDRKFAKDFALNEFWFKNFYTPKDATTDLYIRAPSSARSATHHLRHTHTHAHPNPCTQNPFPSYPPDHPNPSSVYHSSSPKFQRPRPPSSSRVLPSAFPHPSPSFHQPPSAFTPASIVSLPPNTSLLSPSVNHCPPRRIRQPPSIIHHRPRLTSSATLLHPPFASYHLQSAILLFPPCTSRFPPSTYRLPATVNRLTPTTIQPPSAFLSQPPICNHLPCSSRLPVAFISTFTVRRPHHPSSASINRSTSAALTTATTQLPLSAI